MLLKDRSTNRHNSTMSQPIAMTLQSKNPFSRTWHARTFEIVQTARHTFFLRMKGKQVRDVSVVTAETRVHSLRALELVILSLAPDQEYHLHANSTEERDEWLQWLQAAIAIESCRNVLIDFALRTNECPCKYVGQKDDTMLSILKSKNPFSLTWHTRTFELVKAQSYIFILRKHDKQLRCVSAVTSRSKVRLLGNHDLHITSLEPSQEYHLRFSDSRTSDGNENSDRDDWYDNLRGARQKQHGSMITVALGNVGPQQ